MNRLSVADRPAFSGRETNIRGGRGGYRGGANCEFLIAEFGIWNGEKEGLFTLGVAGQAPYFVMGYLLELQGIVF